VTSLDKSRDRDDKPGQEWATLTAAGPYGAQIGSALITMVEPHVGHEAAYNRWYEDDHFISGAMAFPWVFAGRRWVAPRDLQLLRYPESSPIADPVTAGCYLSVYWLIDGRYKEQFYWATATNNRLNADGRGFDQHRTHVFTNYQYYGGATYRDGDVGPRDTHALDHPYRGLVLEVVDADEGVDRADLDAWLAEVHLPKVATGPVAMSLRWEPIPMPVRKGEGVKVLDTPGLDRRLTILHFLEADPRDCWADHFVGNGATVAAGGLGQVVLAAPFIPTLPGTERYVDELR
jgi:hypothetical protein